MSGGKFLDIPNEKIISDFKRLGIKPITGRYYRASSRFSEQGCCPISCQLVAAEKASLAAYKDYTLSDIAIENLAKEYWEDLSISHDDGFTNLVLFLHGFDSVMITKDSPYLQKGRELRALLFGKE